MKRWVCWIGLCAVAAMTGIACGDSETSTSGTGGAGGTGGSGGAGGSDGGMCDPDAGKSTTEGCVTVNDCDKFTYTGTMPPAYTCDGSKSTKNPDSPNACRNDADCAIINTGKVRDIVRLIALACREHEPPRGAPEAERIAACKVASDCNTSQVTKETAKQIMEPGLSEACGQCYTNIALCSISFCLSACAANADAIECVKCQFEQGCRLIYERCSGLDRQE